jgi:hypothetical protein
MMSLIEKPKSRLVTLGMVTVFVWMQASVGHSASGFDVDSLNPNAELGSMVSLWNADVPAHLSVGMGVWVNAAYRAVHFEVPSLGLPEGDIVRWRGEARLTALLGLFDHFAIGLDIPYVFMQSGIDNAYSRNILGHESLGEKQLGDVAVLAEYQILKQSNLRPALSLGGRVVLPTGQPSDLTGEGALRVEPLVALSRIFGSLGMMANAGYRFRTQAAFLGQKRIGDQVFWGVGGEYALVDRSNRAPQSLALELGGNIPVSAQQGEGQQFSLDAKVALNVSSFVSDEGTFDFKLGAQIGIVRTPGLPLVRGFVAMGFTSSNIWKDSDQDGLVDRHDSCVDAAEDYDGLADSDGCPEFDYDGDRVDDVEDDCPALAEDLDGVDDFDGCPEAEVGDRDDDSFMDDIDRCPGKAEDFDGFQDDDGCPELDNDKDGLNDINDVCPDAAEDFNGHEDDDGCPDAGGKAKLYSVKDNRVIVYRAIVFEQGRAKLKKQSAQVLDQLASFVTSNKTIRKLSVTLYPKRRSLRGITKRQSKALLKAFVRRGVPKNKLSITTGKWSPKKAGKIALRVIRNR